MDKHYCTCEQQEKLWGLGLRTKAVCDLYSAEELIDLLPYELGGRRLILQKYYNGYKIYYADEKSKMSPVPDSWEKAHKSLAQLAADRLIWLIEEGLI